MAAPTTSLPEDIGGVRNWDYRYCWLRDATITLEALLRTGYTAEAAAWREWLERAGRRQRPATCRSCTGWRASGGWPSGRPAGCPATSTRPRCGSATPPWTSASSTCTARSSTRSPWASRPGSGSTGTPGRWSAQLLEFLEKHWDEPDEGIWEVRGPRRHFVHSKVMAWVAFDRACQVAELARSGALDRWRAVRDQIHAEICEQGYDAERGTFTQYYGSTGAGRLGAAACSRSASCRPTTRG